MADIENGTVDIESQPEQLEHSCGGDSQVAPTETDSLCEKRPILRIESRLTATLVVLAIVASIVAFLYMAWRFDLLQKAIPEFDLE